MSKRRMTFIALLILIMGSVKARDRPNFIFIFADDLGWGDLGCYGQNRITTPYLDKMAKEGILLTQFYVSNPVCSPSRTAVMTGQYPSRHRIHRHLTDDSYRNDSFRMADYLDPTKEQMAPYEKYGAKGPALERGFSTPAQIFYASVNDLDHQIGRLLQRVEELGLSENTIIVFSSDNGPEDILIANAAHSGIGSPGPFRGRKRSLYEGGIRVPFIVKWKGHVPEGGVDTQSIVGSVDLLPTFCSLAGIDLPADYNPDGTRIELYDFEADPQCMEVDNLADQYPEVVRRYREELLGFYRSIPKGLRVPGAGSNHYPMPE